MCRLLASACLLLCSAAFQVVGVRADNTNGRPNESSSIGGHLPHVHSALARPLRWPGFPSTPKKGTVRSRSLSQKTASASQQGADCSLSRTQRTMYLDASSRTWTVNEEGIERLENDLQTIIDCSEEDDTILLKLRQIQPARRLVVPHRLTIRGSIYRDSETSVKTVVTCPSRNEGSFLLKPSSILLENIDFVNCSLESTSPTRAIIEAELCHGDTSSGHVHLHNVDFRNNMLTESVAFLMPAATCWSVEMINVGFLGNTCSGPLCGASLSVNNDLRNIKIEGNRHSSQPGHIPSLVYTPPGSFTHAELITASENIGSCFLIREASLQMENASFFQNDASSTNSSACIHLMGSNAVIDNCTFEVNRAQFGAALSMTSSIVNLTNSNIKKNRGTYGGGLSLSLRSTVLMEGCTFSENHAKESGGGIWANASVINGRSTAFTKNSADIRGGGLHCQEGNEANLANGTFSLNQAEFGASLYIEKRSIGRFGECSFTNNSATMFGASACIEQDSELMLQQCSFSRNAAGFGGILYSRYSRLNATGCTFKEGTAAVSGGACYTQESNVTMNHCSFFNNTAVDGGALYSWKSTLKLASCSFEHGKASQSGGATYVQLSDVSMADSTFTRNSATSGGAYYCWKSSVKLRNCSFAHGNASDSGGAIDVRKSNITLVNLNCSMNIAGSSGGCLHGANSQNLRLDDFILAGNRAETGAAISIADTTSSCKNGIFRGNVAGRNGGAISVETSVSPRHTPPLNMNPRQSNWEDNNGEVCSNADADVTVANVEFSENYAKDGGSIHVSYSAVVIMGSRFKTGGATEGGFIASSGNSAVSICTSEFDTGMATSNGGCLAVNEGHLLIDSTILENCQCSEKGGAIFLERVPASWIRSSHIVSSRSHKTGGAIHAAESNTHVIDLIVQKNTADEQGGGLYATAASRVSVQLSLFKDNQARHGGAVYHTRKATGDFANVLFSNNSASENGGCLFVGQDAEAAITYSRLHTADASGYGGFIFATANASIIIENSSMAGGSAKDGGAMAISSSSLKARHLNVSQCKAEDDGGALNSRGSEILCVNCVLEDNAAQGNGGAIFFDADGEKGDSISSDARRRRKPMLQLLGATIMLNTAELGGAGPKAELENMTGVFLGGLHFVSSSSAEKCLEDGRECAFAALVGTQFKRNRANSSGGAIFTGYPEAIRFHCSLASRKTAETREARLMGFAKTDRTALSVLSSNKDFCPAWKGNQAGKYGDIVGSYAATAEVAVKSDEYMARVKSGKEYIIEEYHSGKPLPSLSVQLLDKLFQNSSISYHDITATLSATDGLLVGNVSLQIARENERFPSIVGFGSPGNYSINIAFDEKAIKNVTIKVMVPPCAIGEVTVEETRICTPCSSSTYSFDPSSDSCRACPEHGKCETNAITPKNGYWHWTPCSEHLQKCLTSHACKSKDRSQKLEKIAKKITSCEISQKDIENYQQSQCAEGHTGPLCGSCKSKHGSSLSSKCEDCPTDFGNMALILLSAFILLGLSGITIRGTLGASGGDYRPVHQRSEPSQLIGPSAPPSQQGGIGEEQASHEQDPLTDQSAKTEEVQTSDTVLAKWKSIEMLKITLNYIQMTVLIASLDVGWTVPLLIVAELAEFLGGLALDGVRRSVVCLSTDDQDLHPTAVGLVVSVCLVPIAAFLFMALFWMTVAFLYPIERRLRYTTKRCLLSVMVLWYITSVPVLKAALSTQLCIDVHDSLDPELDHVTSYWAVDTSLECFKGVHRTLMAVILPFVCTVYGGLLGLFMIVLGSSKQELIDETSWTYETMGFLYRGYMIGYRRHWEVVVIIRKAVIAFLAFCAQRFDSQLPIVAAAIFVLVVMGWQIWAMPYRKEFDVLNRMDLWSSFTSVLTLLIAAMLKNESFPEDGNRIAATIVCLTLNIVTFGIFICFLVQYGIGFLRLMMEEQMKDYEQDLGAVHVLKKWLTYESIRFMNFVKGNTANPEYPDESPDP